MDRRAVGVLDTGVGGLTAVREMRALMPGEDIVFFADTARVPYGGRSAEELIFVEEKMTTGASNDIEQATKLARAMVTRYGMSDEFDMVALETVQNQYLGGDASLACAAETASRIDSLVIAVVKAAHEKARRILQENEELLHKLSAYLLEKETITGAEFMDILKETQSRM